MSERKLSLHLVFFLELVNPTGRIHEFGFSGKEWVASRANFDVDIADGSSRIVYGSTGCTADFCYSIVWMNSGFHKFPL